MGEWQFEQMMHGRPRWGWVLLTGLVCTVPIAAGSAQDSLPVRPRLSLARLFPLAGLVVAASFADEGLRDLVQGNRGSFGDRLASIGNPLGDPLIMLPALGGALLAGQLSGSRGLSEAAFDATKAGVVAGLAVQFVKFGVGRARPSADESEETDFAPLSARDVFHSFPSGHTAIAFAVATSFAQRVGNGWVAGAVYAGAAMTGFARINDDRHWLSDVLVGGLVGHFSARLLDRRGISVVASAGSLSLQTTF